MKHEKSLLQKHVRIGDTATGIVVEMGFDIASWYMN
jgi:hypothetical protein